MGNPIALSASRLFFVGYDDDLTGQVVFPAAVIVNGLLEREDGLPRQKLSHDQTSKQENKQVAADKYKYLSQAHLTHSNWNFGPALNIREVARTPPPFCIDTLITTNQNGI
jgi:hypothetical protein